ncbi:Imm6 family immunity protein [Listeria booriae]|uniref:Imm6 family immunity protein n=1 Tax=Listeria booriae TaxID=1552123 RepID=UPI0021AB93B2|nr:Imm6 family immunity protein [Listeria booriae]
MLTYFGEINSNGQVALLLALSETVSSKISNAKNFSIAREGLDACWKWLEEKKTVADDLYWYLENLDDTGILTVMQTEEDEVKLKAWICIADALAFTIKEAYDFQGDKYLPATIEAVDINTVEEFDTNFDDIYELTSANKEKIMKYFLEVQANQQINKNNLLRDLGNFID